MSMAPLREGLSYLTSNPMFLVAAAKNAARLGISVPVDLLRWFIDHRPRGKGPERIEITPAPPGFDVGLTVDLFGTKIDIAANLSIASIENTVDALKVGLRVQNLSVKAPPNTPAAKMFGSMDFSKPAALMNMMPQKHAMIVDVQGDVFTLDLLKLKALGENKTLRRVLAVLSDVLSIKDVRTEGQLLVIGLGTNLMALPSALARLRSV